MEPRHYLHDCVIYFTRCVVRVSLGYFGKEVCYALLLDGWTQSLQNQMSTNNDNYISAYRLNRVRLVTVALYLRVVTVSALLAMCPRFSFTTRVTRNQVT